MKRVKRHLLESERGVLGKGSVFKLQERRGMHENEKNQLVELRRKCDGRRKSIVTG